MLSCKNHTNTVIHDGYTTVEQTQGPTLGYSPESGISLIEQDGLLFKDLDRDGVISPYEDWRLGADQRAADLATRLSIEEIAGLMLYSLHQPILSEELTDEQRHFLIEDNLRHVLVTTVASKRIAARWSNKVQALCEGIGHGIPANNSSDPRHTAVSDGEYNAGAGGEISYWPNEIGMGATFDIALVRRFGEIASAEYRALGITTALSPQVDIATDPRWRRFYGTYSEDPALNTAIAEAYCDAFQTTPGEKNGWGRESVNAMVKHWPGGGSGEGGRDAHFCFGKYAVYPGGAFAQHLKPFTEGAFRLTGPTKTASAVMPYYTISHGIDPSGEEKGNNFSRYIISDLLRGQYAYDGVVCTDWAVTHDNPAVGLHSGKPWGVETLTPAERHYEALRAGVDQFGGNNEKQPVLDTYRMWVEAESEEAARKRFELSAKRLLLNIFRCGLFENPYVDPDYADSFVGNAQFCKEGYEAQLKSIVMLKNAGKVIRPATEGAKPKVYVPERHFPAARQFFGGWAEEKWAVPVDSQLLNKYFEVVASPEEADMALCFIHSPQADFGYSIEDAEQGGNGYMPITLQYEDYTAASAREHSIAGGDPKEVSADRGYQGKTVSTYNRDDMLMVQQMRQRMGSKPVITIVETERPFVAAEIEPYTDVLLLTFSISHQAVLDIITGKAEPQGLLPMTMPRNMQTVETQCEDLPHDMVPYVDAAGNSYTFAFGLDWEGRISDHRTKRFPYQPAEINQQR